MIAKEGSIEIALAELQKRLPTISKDQTAHVKSDRAQFSYTYADLAVISKALLPLLAEQGLSWVCRPTVLEGKFVLAYELRHTSGDVIEGVYPLPDPDRRTPQEIGGAITYARRYCLCAVTGVAPDDDDDAQAAEKAARRRVRKEPEQATAPAGPPMDAAQQLRIKELFAALDMPPEAKFARLKYATKAAGRALKSATELTHEEAAKVIAAAEKDLAELPAGPSVERQHNHIFALCGKDNLNMDRDRRLDYCSQIVGREITTSSDLSYGEADKVIAAMTAFNKQQGG